MVGSPRQSSLGKQQILAHSVNSAFGIGLSFVTKALLFLATPSYLATRSRWVISGYCSCEPCADTRIYEVRFPDGRTEELAANVIAEAVYAQCDADGNQYVLLDAIVDYRKDPSVAVARTTRFRSSMKIVKRSTRGWELCCEWKDGSTSWQKLSDLKESHPLQVAEFAFAAQIADEPAFNWWVSWVLKKRDRIVSLVKRRSARYHKRTHKYGIELPKTVEEAYAIDRATGTTFWHDAIEKEMKNVRVAFDVLADGVAPPQIISTYGAI
eukprot:CCRYP_019427-RA/>CCRYP_019427-RA protein AED:0.38 eAED:0.39 QI:0/0/0/1/0/0/3/0/267